MSSKAIIFRATGNAKFFGQKPAAKNEKKLFLYLLNEKKTEIIPSSEMKCPKSGIFTSNYCVGVKADIALSGGTPSQSYTGRHLSYGITQCYLPPDTSERAPPNPSESGKAILQLSIAVIVSGAVEIFLGQRWLTHLEKIGANHCTVYKQEATLSQR